MFQLYPARNFQTFDSSLEYLLSGEAWRLALYCESDEEWHTAEHSLYDFHLDADWVEGIRSQWNSFSGHMRAVAPFLKVVGKLTGKVPIEALGLAAEKLPDISADPRALRGQLGEVYSPSRIDIELRLVLGELIKKLDVGRSPSQTTGGLHKWLNDDGRVLWLCPRHYRALQSRNVI